MDSEEIVSILTDSGILNSFEIPDEINLEEFLNYCSFEGLSADLYNFLKLKKPNHEICKRYLDEKEFHHSRGRSILKNLFTSDDQSDQSFAQEICKEFLIQNILFGKKYLFVNHFNTSKQNINLPVSGHLVDVKSIFHRAEELGSESNENPVENLQRNCRWILEIDDCYHIIHHEVIERTISEEPPQEFLTEVGKKFKVNIKFKRKMKISCFHRSILKKDGTLCVHLIDSNSISSKNSPSESAAEIQNKINTLVSSNENNTSIANMSKLYFFRCIKPLYEDSSIGTITFLNFYTNEGTRYFSAAGYPDDLRVDPFNRGGTTRSPIDIYKMSIANSLSAAGGSSINIEGVYGMMDSVEKSLPFIEIKFGGNPQFLKKILDEVVKYAAL